MLSFKDSFFDENFAKAYAKFNGFERLVFLESEADQRFWTSLFEDADLVDSEFLYYCQNDISVRGKSQYKPYLAKANRHALIAIDSDFDYIAPNHTDCNLADDCNKYVLQTYVYARENITYNADSVEHCLEQIYFSIRKKSEFKRFCEQVSQAIYPLFTLFLYALEHHGDNEKYLTKVQFERFLKLLKLHEAYFNNSYWETIDENMQQQINQLALSFGTENELSCDIQTSCEFNDFVKVLTAKGLEQNNAYRFISGHFWQESIVEQIELEATNRLKTAETERIKVEFNASEIEKRRKEMLSHFKKNCSFNTLINQPNQYQQDNFYQRILADIKALR